MTLWRRSSAWLLGLIVLGLLAVAATALARPAGPRDNPRLGPGAHVVVREDGFAAGASVTVGLVGDHLLGTVRADVKGRIRYQFVVPRGIPDGQHALVFAGAPAHLDRSAAGGNFTVDVPLVRTWRFRTPGAPGGGASAPASAPASSPPGSGGSGGSGVAGAGHGSNGGGTSATGADVLVPLILGGLALVAGVALLLAVRRRPGRL